MKGVWQKATLLSSQVLQMNAHITQCALTAFVFTMVTIVSVKSVLLEGNSTYYDQFLQGFVIRTFPTTFNKFQFHPILISPNAFEKLIIAPFEFLSNQQ